MELLRELHFINCEQNLQTQYKDLEHQYFNVMDLVKKMLTEASDLGFSFNNTTLGDLELNMEELTKMLAAAKRGLGLTAKLNPEQRKQHSAAILSNLNKIRGRLQRLTKEFDYYMAQVGHMTPRNSAPQQRQPEQRRVAPTFSRDNTDFARQA